MGGIFSAIGNGISAVISAIASVIVTIVQAITGVSISLMSHSALRLTHI